MRKSRAEVTRENATNVGLRDIAAGQANIRLSRCYRTDDTWPGGVINGCLFVKRR
jgi:hypothetical protein